MASVFTINGKKLDTLSEALAACREIWAGHKGPLIDKQLKAGGPKKTDPAPAGTDEGERS